MKTLWIIVRAFFLRDLRTALSYRFSVLLGWGNIFLFLLTFFFISRTFDQAATPLLARYGVDYFSYVLVGIAFMSFLQVALTSFTNDIRIGQMTGTLEAILVTPISMPQFLLASGVYNFGVTSLRVLLYLALGGLVFGVGYSTANPGAAVVALVLTILSFSGLGILSASFTLAFKRGDPVTMFLSSASVVFGGVFFPVEVLPPWLQNISALLPMTYALRAVRLALLRGATWGELRGDLIALALFSMILLPLGAAAFRWAIARARAAGSLAHY
jgi:ABC-2 type transport system permease protein